MKRCLLAAFVAALLLAPAGHAATWSGVVIGKSAIKHAILTTHVGGAVRTVRVGSLFSRVDVGRHVTVRATALRDGTFRASHVRLGAPASTVEFEAIFLGRETNGELRLAVARRGEVFVAVPATFALPQLAPGDVVELLVSVDQAGAFTLARIEAQNEQDEVEVKGTITALDAFSITVSPSRGSPVTCSIPATSSVAGFRVGDFAEMKCLGPPLHLVLARLKAEDDDENEENENRGEGRRGGHGGEGREGGGGHGRH
jgi:hypothetical protein